MKAGVKPLSMFVCEPDLEVFPEAEFDALVETGALVKREGCEGVVRRVLYALPAEAWRIDAKLLVLSVYPPGWSADLEHAIGALLGYQREDVERFVAGLCK